ncbi:hypothetical protein [Methanoregula sp.]|uniref:hypothetical protein n=1 Tax=Methanoregula sp. TaxID=2052170 RepID=UPI0025F830F5|nr:hypothetical protein [Methanoregula sp.]
MDAPAKENVPAGPNMTDNSCAPNGTDCPEMDTIQRFFIRPFFLSLTIGIPFCIFKILFGISALRHLSPGGGILAFLALAMTVWAFTDLLMNTGRSLFDLFHRTAPFEFCTIAQVGRIFHKPLIFLAFDTLLTFAIICAMLWTGWIATLSPVESWLWYGATTMNLISLSLVSLYNEIRRGHT